MNRKEAILEALKQERGYGEDLTKCIGVENYNQLCRLGFIKKGICYEQGQPKSTWQLTQTGKSQATFYRKPTTEEKQLGQLLYTLGL